MGFNVENGVLEVPKEYLCIPFHSISSLFLSPIWLWQVFCGPKWCTNQTHIHTGGPELIPLISHFCWVASTRFCARYSRNTSTASAQQTGKTLMSTTLGVLGQTGKCYKTRTWKPNHRNVCLHFRAAYLERSRVLRMKKTLAWAWLGGYGLVFMSAMIKFQLAVFPRIDHACENGFSVCDAPRLWTWSIRAILLLLTPAKLYTIVVNQWLIMKSLLKPTVHQTTLLVKASGFVDQLLACTAGMLCWLLFCSKGMVSLVGFIICQLLSCFSWF